MKRVVWIVLVLFHGTGVFAQRSLEDLQARAREYFPVARQHGLIERGLATTLEDAGKGYLPRVTVAARATYQSEVTRLPVSLPGMNVQSLSRDQYQATVEVNQVLWDGGRIPAVKRAARATAGARAREADVELFALGERVNQLFFGVLLAEEQLRLTGLLQEDLQRTAERVAAHVEKGVARETDLDAVRVELARAGQQEVEARSTRDAYRAMLGALVGEEVGDLLKPTPPGEVPAGAGRPELALFRARAEMQESRLGVTLAGTRPRVGLFVQGGYGNPGLNMLENAFTPYYIGGIRLSWDIGSLYTLRGERRQVSLDREMVEVGRDAFLVNLSAETARARSEVEKWRALLDRDDEIIVLRERIAGSAAAGVEGGIVSVSEWTREVNRLDQARQARALHEIQWLLAIYTLNLTRGVL